MGNPLNWKGDQKGLALHCGLLGVWSDSDIYHKYICSYHINVLIRFGLAINAFPLICESIVSCMISKLTWVIPMSIWRAQFWAVHWLAFFDWIQKSDVLKLHILQHPLSTCPFELESPWPESYMCQLTRSRVGDIFDPVWLRNLNLWRKPSHGSQLKI